MNYLASLEMDRREREPLLVGPAGAGECLLIVRSASPRSRRHGLRCFTAAELVETLFRALADDSVGKTIENLLRHDLVIVDEVGFAPLDATGTQLLFRLSPPAYERRSLGIAGLAFAGLWASSCPNTPPRSALLTTSCPTPTS